MQFILLATITNINRTKPKYRTDRVTDTEPDCQPLGGHNILGNPQTYLIATDCHYICNHKCCFIL